MKLYQFHDGDPAGRQIFDALIRKVADGAWDDEYLLLLLDYQKRYPASEKFEVFYALYALGQNNPQLALAFAKDGERKRRVSPMIWEILAACYEHLGKVFDGALYRAYLRVHCRRPLQVSIPEGEEERYLALFSCAARIGSYAPFISRANFVQEGIAWEQGVYAGELLPQVRAETHPYWVGVYLEEGDLNSHGWLLARSRADRAFAEHNGADLTFDLWRSAVQQELHVPCAPGEQYILPVAGTEPEQLIDFSTGGQRYVEHAGQYRYSFYRIEERTEIRSEKPFAAAQPIRLGHSPQRRKLVFNILVDALSWPAVKERQYADVPNMMRFFSKGIIFNNHFSAAEYTYPSLASIETGMYLHHNQVFNELFGQEIDPAYMTISERMKELGYFCVNTMGTGSSIYNGVTRGFDRIILDSVYMMGYEAVERAIRHIQAFDECDQFQYLHLLDTHMYPARVEAIPLATQTHLPLGERLAGSGDEQTSVSLPSRPIYIEANRATIRSADRALGVLFDYLERNFRDDEYIVHLYSDHGVPVYETEPYLTSEKQVGAALMMRGGDIPALGMVEELTSGVDIYNIVAHNVGFPAGENVDGNLPAALGGKARDYVISNSIYPGKRYELGIRTMAHEFRLSSEGLVGMDGTVDLSGAQMAVWNRTPEHENIDDDAVFQYFYEIAKEFTHGTINHEGHCWPET